jgi:N-acetylmuramoyl-L-alanine amidase
MFGKNSLYIIFCILAIFIVPFTTLHAESKKPIKILLVPGHDEVVWGAQYGNIKEADMTLDLAHRIYNILKKDKNFDVHITRDQAGYTKEFADYFDTQREAIVAFKKNAKEKTKNEISSGTFIQKQNPPHHGVSEDVSIHLYGINKWANENNVDAIIHIHFNDYPRKSKWTLGKYRGFVVYFPDGELLNFRQSANLAGDIFTQLHKKYSTSTYKPELGGLIPDQKLIALGSNKSLDASVRSVLVEYGYIYEKKFRTKSARVIAFKDMAMRTVKGIEKYFSETSP